jgi:hypothetical protein
MVCKSPPGAVPSSSRSRMRSRRCSGSARVLRPGPSGSGSSPASPAAPGVDEERHKQLADTVTREPELPSIGSDPDLYPGPDRAVEAAVGQHRGGSTSVISDVVVRSEPPMRRVVTHLDPTRAGPSPSLVDIGFHLIDGARWVRRQGFDHLARLALATSTLTGEQPLAIERPSPLVARSSVRASRSPARRRQIHAARRPAAWTPVDVGPTVHRPADGRPRTRDEGRGRPLTWSCSPRPSRPMRRCVRPQPTRRRNDLGGA